MHISHPGNPGRSPETKSGHTRKAPGDREPQPRQPPGRPRKRRGKHPEHPGNTPWRTKRGHQPRRDKSGKPARKSTPIEEKGENHREKPREKPPGKNEGTYLMERQTRGKHTEKLPERQPI